MSLIQKPPKTGTKQELKVAQILNELGVRYDTQVNVGNYWCDFVIQEVPYAIEADGFYGHLKKADAKRDEELKQLGIEKIIHIKTSKLEEIRQILLREIFDIGENHAGN